MATLKRTRKKQRRTTKKEIEHKICSTVELMRTGVLFRRVYTRMMRGTLLWGLCFSGAVERKKGGGLSRPCRCSHFIFLVFGFFFGSSIV